MKTGPKLLYNINSVKNRHTYISHAYIINPKPRRKCITIFFLNARIGDSCSSQYFPCFLNFTNNRATITDSYALWKVAAILSVLGQWRYLLALVQC